MKSSITILIFIFVSLQSLKAQQEKRLALEIGNGNYEKGALKNPVNVLILEACRDNPFESNWNPQAQSTNSGQGLAKTPTPTGSLIVYYTDTGNTAADGDGKNSIYCVSLTENMQLENTTLDQVFSKCKNRYIKSLRMIAKTCRGIKEKQLEKLLISPEIALKKNIHHLTIGELLY